MRRIHWVWCAMLVIMASVGTGSFLLWRKARIRDRAWVLETGLYIRQYAGVWITDEKVIEVLVEPDTNYEDLLSRYANENSELARRRLLWAVGALGDRAALEPLKRIVRQSTDDIERGNIFWALGYLGDERALDFLRQHALRGYGKSASFMAADAASWITGEQEPWRDDDGRVSTVDGLGGAPSVRSLRKARREYVQTGQMIEYVNPVTRKKQVYRPDPLAVEARKEIEATHRPTEDGR